MSVQIFISYRREGGYGNAQSIYDRLTNDGYECFLDTEKLGSGTLDNALRKIIEECEDFLLVLPLNGLNRCSNPEDWVRKEIEHAVKYNKNIVPIMEQGFEFPNDLPESLKFLKDNHGLNLGPGLFDKVISALEDEKRTPEPLLHSKVRYRNLHRKYKMLPIMSGVLILIIAVVFAFSPKKGIAEINSNDEVTIDAYTEKIKTGILRDVTGINGEISPDNNDTEKFAKILKEAEKGNLEAMVKVADYYGGIGDFKKAFTWSLKAAEAGSIDGLFQVAEAYSFGLGVEENKEQAQKYFTEVYERIIKEADLDDSYDRFCLGAFYFMEYCCLNSEDVGKKAFDCLAKSADSGVEDGRFLAGFCYLLGIGTERNDEKAFEYFNKAFTSFEDISRQSSPSVAEMLKKELEYNSWKPIQLSEEERAELGNGKILKIGESPESEQDELIIPIPLSDYLGSTVAFLIGYCYAEGRGTDQDYQKAFEWFRKSADLGNAEAMANIGAYYWQGKGVEKDYDQAFNWCLRAADAGSVTAMNTLGKIYYIGEGTQQNYEKAFEWFEKAANAFHVEAMKNLSIMYKNGEGVGKDKSKAREWEQKYEQYQKKLMSRKNIG